MKTRQANLIINAGKVACAIVAMVMINIVSIAQDKMDIVVMRNGEKKEGKVTAVNGPIIKFKYKGEDLEYEFNKSDIDYVEFSSGRKESYADQSTKAAGQVPTTTSPEERRGKLAVIPFEFNTNDQSLMPDKMSKDIQADCIGVFKKLTHGVTVIDASTVNAILAQHNITLDNYAATMPKDLARLLGVQYVVIGKADIMNKGTTSYGSGVSTYKEKDSQSKDGNKNSKSSGTAVTSSSSTTTIEYGTKVSMDIYDDEGNSVFSQKRDTFGSTLDAYIGSLDYMTKRTPFGSKGKN